MLTLLKIYGWRILFFIGVMSLIWDDEIRFSRVAQASCNLKHPVDRIRVSSHSDKTGPSLSLSLPAPSDSGLVRRRGWFERVSTGVGGDDAEVGIYKWLRGKRDSTTPQHKAPPWVNPHSLLRQPLVHLYPTNYARRIRHSSRDKCSHSQDGRGN